MEKVKPKQLACCDGDGRRSRMNALLMGMESPDNRRKADDSYRALMRW